MCVYAELAAAPLDEVLRIRRDEQLPVYERLGATRDLLVGQANSALILLERNAPGAEKMGIPEADQIREIMADEGLEI